VQIVGTLEARGIRAISAGGFSSAAIDEAKQVRVAYLHTHTHAHISIHEDAYLDYVQSNKQRTQGQIGAVESCTNRKRCV
jgi:hypothetical protein